MRWQMRSTSDRMCDERNTVVRPGARELVDRLGERFDHQRIEAGGRLVEDEQRRLGHQRLNQSELALHPVRVVAHAPLADRDR